MWMTRRSVLATAAAATCAPAFASAPQGWAEFIESQHGGRLGVSAHDLHSGRSFSHRADERFPMCSTFKLLAVGAVLARVDAGSEKPERQIPFGKADLLEYAPVTTAHVAEGHMTVSALCAAAIEESDNTAANLLMKQIGGPAGVTAYARTLGDTVTRLDRWEPELNTAVEGDERDTTTPSAMMGNLRALVMEGALSKPSRDLLVHWLVNSTTGVKRIRAGVPTDWNVGDKAGTGMNGATNDIAVCWPPGGTRAPPILIAAYYVGAQGSEAERSRALAEVGRRVVEDLTSER